MKKFFITGLVLLLPLALTLMIIDFLLNLLTGPFMGLAQGAIEYFELHHDNGHLLAHPFLQLVLSKVLILTALFVFTVLLGRLGEWVFVHYLIRFWDSILHRIPFVRSIYKAFKEVIGTFFSRDKEAFKQVVLVPFPDKKSLCLGMVTMQHFISQDGVDRLAVFIPSTPHMTAGFLVMVKKEDVQYLDLKTEEAVRFVISGGVVI